MLNYRKTFFDPATLPGFSPISPRRRFVAAATDQPIVPREDWAYGAASEVFVFMQEAVLAINVALATGRPLLVSGEPGGGKTSLALRTATALRRSFYRQTVTSRTQVTDLLSSFDAVGRLGDAQRRVEKPNQAYVVPGALWWGLSPDTAAQRGLKPQPDLALLPDPDLSGFRESGLVLLDEIDKADPDVPNDLLEVLDERKFTVRETGDEIVKARQHLLIVLTTNDERELPQAFLRRCVTLELQGPPDAEWLVEIARRRYPTLRTKGQTKAEWTAQSKTWDELCVAVAHELMGRRQRARDTGRRKPSTSEFLDALKACRELVGGADFTTAADLTQLLNVVLIKDRTNPTGG